MFSRTALRKVFVQPWTSTSVTTATAAILPQRASITTTSSNNASPTPEAPLSATPRAQTSQPTKQPPVTPSTPKQRSDIPSTKQPVAPTFDGPVQVTKALIERLPYLTSQKPHYISAHLHDKPYLLTEGDQLRLPFLMPKVKTGDVLRLNRASVLGSREFTLKGAPYVDERLFECRVRVVGVDAEPMRIKEKTKRRRRHVQHIRSKHRYTLLKVMDVKIKTVEELQQAGAVVVEGGNSIEVKA